MRILSILDWYIIKKFLGTYIFSIILIISIAVVFDVNERLDKFINNDAPLQAIVFDYYLNFIPYFANLFGSLFVFISVIFFTSKLAENSEVIAMLSNGMSFRRLMKPYMISAAVVSFVTFMMSSFIIPPSNVTRINFQNKYIKDKSVSNVDKIQIQLSEGSILYIGRYESRDHTGYNILIDKFEGKELVSRLQASRLVYDTAYHWVLQDYSIRDFNHDKEIVRSGTAIDTTLNITPGDFLISENGYEQMTTPVLYDFIQKQKERGLAVVGNVSVKQYEIAYYQRFASIFSAFILTIIGASLSSRKMKGGMGMNIGVGLALSVSYILFQTISSSFAVSGSLSPLVAVWIPNIVFMFIAALLYSRAPN